MLRRELFKGAGHSLQIANCARQHYTPSLTSISHSYIMKSQHCPNPTVFQAPSCAPPDFWPKRWAGSPRNVRPSTRSARKERACMTHFAFDLVHVVHHNALVLPSIDDTCKPEPAGVLETKIQAKCCAPVQRPWVRQHKESRLMSGCCGTELTFCARSSKQLCVSVLQGSNKVMSPRNNVQRTQTRNAI